MQDLQAQTFSLVLNTLDHTQKDASSCLSP